MIVVTGGAKGLGRRIARTLAEAGCSVCVTGRDQAGLVQFGKCLCTEVRDQGIGVTTITPPWSATGFS
jgi:NAD(P)-dependent dehydrogenase (short-subunit alcohol dehydrogenase family)